MASQEKQLKRSCPDYMSDDSDFEDPEESLSDNDDDLPSIDVRKKARCVQEQPTHDHNPKQPSLSSFTSQEPPLASTSSCGSIQAKFPLASSAASQAKSPSTSTFSSGASHAKPPLPNSAASPTKTPSTSTSSSRTSHAKPPLPRTSSNNEARQVEVPKTRPEAKPVSRPPPAQPRAQHEGFRPVLAQHESSRPVPTQHESSRPVPTQHESSRPVPTQHESSRPVPAQHESSRPVLAQHESSQPVPTQHESSRPVPTQHESSRPVTTQHESSRPVPTHGGLPKLDLSVDSPLRAADHHHNTEVNKLFSKTRKLSRSIKESQEKTERERKIQQLQLEGGIRAVAKEKEESSSLSDEENSDAQISGVVMSPSGLHRNTSTMSAVRPPLPTKPPGKAIFVNPPSLVTELYPPGLEVQEGSMFAKLEQNLMQESPDSLKEMICGGWLKLCYQSKQCPLTMWQWLFQIMTRSSDTVLSNAAFRNLMEILQTSARRNDLASVHPPLLADIVDVVTCLGADQDKLVPCSESTAVDANDVFDVPRVPVGNLACMVKYITACIRVLPSCYAVEELESLVNLLLNIALDPHVCGQVVEKDISQCVGTVLRAIPEESWGKVAESLCSQAVMVSEHHHNRLYLAHIISGASRRQRFLQKEFCRECIVQSLGLKSEGQSELNGKDAVVKLRTEGDATPLDSDCSFVHQVIVHYYYHQKPETYDYYSFYSILTMLSLFMHPSEMKWPTVEERKRFEVLLSSLSSDRLKDACSIDKMDMIPVKDLIVRMKLEVSSHKVVEPRQTDLYAFLS